LVQHKIDNNDLKIQLAGYFCVFGILLAAIPLKANVIIFFHIVETLKDALYLCFAEQQLRSHALCIRISHTLA